MIAQPFQSIGNRRLRAAKLLARAGHTAFLQQRMQNKQ
jgi:hypothetical protein